MLMLAAGDVARVLRGSRPFLPSWSLAFLAGSGVAALPPILAGIGGEWFRDTILDAGEKKRIEVPQDVLDALSGGLFHLLDQGAVSFWFVIVTGVAPFALGLVLSREILGGRPRRAERAAGIVLASSAIGMLVAERLTGYDILSWIWMAISWFLPYGVLVGGVLLGLFRGAASSNDRRSSGLVLVGLFALAHALSHQLSWKGPAYITQGWSCNVALGAAASIVAFRALGPEASRWYIRAFFAAALLPFLLNAATGGFERNFDGASRMNTVLLDHPLARGMGVSPAKADVLERLQSHVRPGDTCYVHGNSAILYDLLGCENPTRLDIDTFDFTTRQDAREAIVALEAAPPQWIVVALGATAPPRPELRDLVRSGWDPDSAAIIALGVGDLLRNYELVTGPEDSKASNGPEPDMDRVRTIRLYRRIDPPVR